MPEAATTGKRNAVRMYAMYGRSCGELAAGSVQAGLDLKRTIDHGISRTETTMWVIASASSIGSPPL